MNSPAKPFKKPFPLLLILFGLSGAAALIYEIVWLQLLQLVIGSSAVSLAVLLGTWMGGMCFGSVFFARTVAAHRNPLRVYAILELGTAAFGILVLFLLPLIEHVYTAGVAHGLPNMVLRGIACAICLLPPTLLMGATLPAISRWVADAPNAAAWWGYFYGANIAGGVLGCFSAGFYLLRVHDMAFASYVAAAANVIVALAALVIERFDYEEEAPHAEEQPEAPLAHSQWSVYVSIALSGLCALGAEVVWTRILSLMLGPTVYTFSIILGVFLTGLGIGSAAGSHLAHRKNQPRFWLGMCQFALCVTVAWAAFMLADSLPYWPGNLNSNAGPWKDFLSDIGRAAVAILPAAFLWGASFPLALASVAGKDEDPARLVGGVYGANTVGAIAGSILFSMVFIPAVGTLGSQQLLIAFSCVGAVVVLEGAVPRMTLKLVAGIACAAVLAWIIPAIPWMLIGFGRRLPTTTGRWDLLHEAEGMNSSAAWSRWEGGTIYFHVSGKVEASTEPQDMSLQRMLGHLPALVHPDPQSDSGGRLRRGRHGRDLRGASRGEAHHHLRNRARHPAAIATATSATRITTSCTIPRTPIVYDDARHFVLTSPEKFDIITSDPIHPWVKGMATLYTTEYFEMCKRHLNPGGIVTQWVPLYESSVDAVKSEIATFFEAFPNGTIWGNVDTDGQGYDLVLMGQIEKLSIDMDAMRTRLSRPEYAAVRTSLNDAGFPTAMDLLATYAAQASDLRAWMKGAQINRDRNLRLQYLAGLGLNTNAGELIYSQMLSPAVFPDNIFTGSPESLATLRSLFHRRRF